jgi:hypothetical protein
MMISVIARHKNLTKAANEMGVTPSALTRVRGTDDETPHELAQARARFFAA